MKQILVLKMLKHAPLSFLVFATITLFSCSHGELKKHDANTLALSNSGAILSAFNEGLSPNEHGEYLAGEVDFYQYEDSLLIIHINASSGDDNIVYMLQTEREYAFESGSWEYGEVLFLENQLFVTNTVSRDDYWFKITSVAAPDLLNMLEIDSIYEGFGLIRVMYPKDASGISWSDPTTFKVSCKCSAGGSSDSDCDAGGEWSSSCGVSNNGQSCNASCDSRDNALYSCCELDAMD